jgi:hypothetical protein
VSTATQALYTRAWQAFNDFREKLGREAARAAGTDEISDFIGQLSLDGKAPATICGYVAGIGFWHRIKFGFDATDNCVVRQLLKGVRRGNRPPDSRAALHDGLFERFLTILPTLVSSQYELLLFRAALAVGFFGFLRVREFTAGSRRDPESPLAVGDVEIVRNSQVRVSIKRAKNNQNGRAQIVCLPASKDRSRPCPVQILSEFKTSRPPNAQAFLCHFDGSHLTQYQVQSMIKRGSAALGLKERITSHSLRIGGATTAWLRQWPEEAIKAGGRWKSSAYRRYIRVPGTAGGGEANPLTLM